MPKIIGIGISGNFLKMNQSNNQILHQYAFLKQFSEIIPLPFYVIDIKNFQIRLSNISNLSDNSTCFSLSHRRDKPCDTENHNCPIEIVKNTKKPAKVEHIHYDEKGNARYIEVHCYPIFNSDGEVEQAIEYFFDITEHKRMEKALIFSTEQKQVEDELRSEVSSLKQYLLSDSLEDEESFSSIITKNKKMWAIFQYTEVIAKSKHPILISGETGAGKELIARAIHNLSRLKGNFIAVNLAGLDDTMFSDTLFGHKKGSFTGADQSRDGLIAQASDGTIFLDEIGDLSESLQIKLLRLLDEHTYYPLGSDTPKQSNARIIFATNKDISTLMNERRFRKDLYYRICAHQIHIPPLRERKEDIPLLLEHFFKEVSRTFKKKPITPSSELIKLISAYDFPGNVRELKAMVFDAVAQHKSGKSLTEGFKNFMGQVISSPRSFLSAPKENGAAGEFPTLKESESYLISEALKRSSGNQSKAASLLGISSQALNKRLRRKHKKSEKGQKRK